MLSKDKLLYITAALAAFCGIIFALKDIILPFVAALLLAYLLRPLAQKMTKLGISHTVTATLLTIGFFASLLLFSIWIMPLFYEQIKTLGQKTLSLHPMDNPITVQFMNWLKVNAPHLQEQAEANITTIISHLLSFTSSVLGNLLYSGMFIINLFSLLLVTPFVMFYAVRDWEAMLTNVSGIIPQRYHADCQEIMQELDNTISGYLRGQFYVSSILAIYYAICLNMTGLEAGFALGILTGILTFIPYIGAFFALVLCTLSMLSQYPDLYHIIMLFSIFAAGSFMEGNILSPKLIGKNVGLHPVWIVFGLLACASILNFLGVLIAVPLTATIGVFIKFSLRKYKHSKFFTSM